MEIRCSSNGEKINLIHFFGNSATASKPARKPNKPAMPFKKCWLNSIKMYDSQRFIRKTKQSLDRKSLVALCTALDHPRRLGQVSGFLSRYFNPMDAYDQAMLAIVRERQTTTLLTCTRGRDTNALYDQKNLGVRGKNYAARPS